ncbi:hypothetical protein WICPIJ_009744 [Wickerhamomyces pijperi]|uniref:Autophagy-related protein 17 n=1 Tax=Wickerhamomyces pijperi TaxID=599730 RepID=A0A9P8PL17_WICPI|nr:hypothetical protein WICPIJ_009744 [Wickerhamomyces pijperi]
MNAVDPVKWTKDATQKLHEAQTIGAKANNLLLQTRNSVKSYDEQLSKGNFLLDAIDQQLQTLETIQKVISEKVNKRQQTVADISDYLTSSIDALETQYQHLQDIKIDKALNSKSDTLYDLVTTDILTQLNGKDQDVNNICTNCVAELKERDRIVHSKIKSFVGDFNKLESKTTELGELTWVETALEELREFEEEIASLIESVTSHYDQCSRGSQVDIGELDIAEDEKRELFEVLEKDYRELPEVMNDIEETFHDIESRCRRIMDFNSDQPWFNDIVKLLQSLTTFGEIELTQTLQFLEKQTTIITERSHEITEKCQESKEIIAHYKSFIKAYYSLILEIQRRNNTKSKILQIIKETQLKLSQIQDDDYKQRSLFLQRHGAFLPSDLYLGINDIEEPLFKLQYELTDVPVFDKELISLAERYLKSSSREGSV